MAFKPHLAPRDVLALASRPGKPGQREPMLVVTPYLTPSTRERLRAHGIGYLDRTGNARIVLEKPGLFIETHGADEDPDPAERPARSLRGPKAGRIVRALVDRRVPPGVRELATATRVDAGYVSRVLTFLGTEALISRAGRGRIEKVDWAGLLRRWALEAPLETRGQIRAYLGPRGLAPFLQRLGLSRETYALTGGLAAARLAPLSPPRLAAVWIRDAAGAAERFGLRPAESGANVLLIEPVDDLVFEGAASHDGLRYAAPSQVAVDLLTSPGRGPAEAEALIDWMRDHEAAWRG